LVALGVSVWAQAVNETPRVLLLERVKFVKALKESGLSVESPTLAGRVALKPERFMVDVDPDQAVDLERWHENEQSVGEMPLSWDPAAGRFGLSRLQLEGVTSDAQVWFTWNFLRAYARLAPDLRKSGSTLAVGAAAVVAAAVVYPENWACLPDGVRDAASIFTLLSLYSPGLQDACLGADAAGRRKLVRDAVNAMNQTDGGAVAAGPVLSDLRWLDSAPLTPGAAGRPVGVGEFLPHDPAALGRLVVLVNREVPNLTIRARVVANACPLLYGVPGSGPSKDAVAKDWETELDALLVATRDELNLRDREINQKLARGAVIVPRFEPKPEREMRLRSDPAVLEPLMKIAGQLARDRLREARKNGGASGFLDALKSEKTTSQVLVLAGVDPVIEPLDTREAGAERHITRLTWAALERFSRIGHKPYPESVQVELSDDQPSGRGRSLGIGADNRVITLEANDRRTIRHVSKVGHGASVLGYVRVGQPSRGEMFRVGTDVQEAWFRVLDVRADSRTDVAELRLDDGTFFRFGGEHRVLQALGKSAVWRKAGELRPSSELWGKPSDQKGRPRLDRSVATGNAVRVVEFSLSWDKERGRATNLLVLPPGDADGDGADALSHGPAVLAEARSVDFGPIAADLLVQTLGPKGREVTWVRADQLAPAAAEPSVLTGFYLQGEDDPWREVPWLSRHPARVLSRETVDVSEGVRLLFEDGRSVIVGPGNWVLVRHRDGKSGVPVEVAKEKPVGGLRAGDELVADVRDGVLETVRLKSTQPVPPGGSPRYVLLRAENLPWCKVGPVLVSVEARLREDDAASEGLAAATQVAVRGPGGRLRYDPIPKPSGNEETVRNWPVAAVEPTVPQLLREPVMTGVRPRDTTQTVSVEAAPHPAAGGLAASKTLECAPGQLLLVRRKIDEGRGDVASTVLAAVPARELHRGDELIVMDANEAFSNWPVRGLTHRFHEPPVTTWLLENRRPRHFELNRAALVNGGLGVVLSVPGEAETPGGRAPEAPPGEGGNAGTTPGPITLKGREAPDLERGLVAQLPPGATEDMIHFPGDTKAVLEQFGNDLLARFEAEALHLRAPAEGDSALLRYWGRNFAGRGVPWPYAAPDVSAELRIWVDALVGQRKRFLAEPRSLALPPILLQEMVLASWLREAGSPRLSDMVLADLVELVVFAGCEPGRERVRLGEHLGLRLVLYAPGFVRGAEPGRTAEPVSPAAQRLVRDWGGNEGNNLVSDGGVVLRVLYVEWRDRARPFALIGMRLPPFWGPPTPADQSTNKTKGAARAAREAFDGWVIRQVRALGHELPVMRSMP